MECASRGTKTVSLEISKICIKNAGVSNLPALKAATTLEDEAPTPKGDPDPVSRSLKQSIHLSDLTKTHEAPKHSPSKRKDLLSDNDLPDPPKEAKKKNEKKTSRPTIPMNDLFKVEPDS